jgi:nicotinamide mononucleotide (NMN) deamidase PncC
VGEVWIAWADRDNGFLQADRCTLTGDRNAIRDQAVQAAIAGLISALTDSG